MRGQHIGEYGGVRETVDEAPSHLLEWNVDTAEHGDPLGRPNLIGGVPAVPGVVDDGRAEQADAVVMTHRLGRQPGPARKVADAEQIDRSVSHVAKLRGCPGATASQGTQTAVAQ